MNLTPTELERLTVFTAAEMARRNLREGVLLSHPEAVALLTDEVMLAARKNLAYDEVVDMAANLLQAKDCEPGVPDLVRMVMIDAPFPDGTKLVALIDPITPAEDDIRPGRSSSVTNPSSCSLASSASRSPWSTAVTGTSRCAVNPISTRPTRRWSSIAARRGGTSSTSPPVAASGSSQASRSRSALCRWAVRG